MAMKPMMGIHWLHEPTSRKIEAHMGLLLNGAAGGVYPWTQIGDQVAQELADLRLRGYDIRTIAVRVPA